MFSVTILEKSVNLVSAFSEKFKLLKKNFSIKPIVLIEAECPSPDGRENPFVPVFGTKDWKEQQETAPSSYKIKNIIIN